MPFVGVPLLFQMAFSAVLVWHLRIQAEADRQYVHTQEVLAQAHLILQLLVDSETGQRGLVLTGDSAFAEPYEGAVRELPEALRWLLTLVSDNPSQLVAARTIRDNAERVLEFHAENQ